MKSAIRRALTVAVILVIISPVAVVLGLQTKAVTSAVNPMSYIPHHSNEVMSISYDQNRLILFSTSSGTGYVFQTNPWIFYSLLHHNNPNVTSNVSFTEVTHFLEIPVYKLSNLQPFSILSNSTVQSAMGQLNVTSGKFDPSTHTLFFSNPARNIFVFGNLSTVESSLSQHSTSSASGPFDSLLNTSAEISFMIRMPSAEYIQQVSGNLTGNTLSILVHFTHSVYSADFFALYLLSLLGNGIIIVPVNAFTDQMILNMNNIRFLPIFSLLQNSLGGI